MAYLVGGGIFIILAVLGFISAIKYDINEAIDKKLSQYDLKEKPAEGNGTVTEEPPAYELPPDKEEQR